MKTLAVIGASYLQMPVVQKAKAMGLRVICFAWAEGAVCKDLADKFYPISIIEKEAILQVCQEEKIDAICTIASDVAVLTVNYVAEKMGLIGNPDAYSIVTTNKYQMRQCFAEHHIPSPKFMRVDANKQYDIADFTFPLIVKPTDRSGSRGVEKVLNEAELAQAIDRALGESFAGEVVVEEFVTGREVSVESISYQGKHYVLQITDKVTTEEPYFVELEHHQPSTLPAAVQDEIRRIVPLALDALHIENGAAHSEIKIMADGQLRFIEIGARMGGDFIGSDLVRLATGYDFLRATIEVALGIFTEPRITEHNYAGVYFLSKDTAHIRQYIENKDKYPQIVQAEITDEELHRIECSADRSGYFIYQGNEKFCL